MMRKKDNYFFICISIILFVVIFCAIAFGAVSILPKEMFSALKHFITNKEPASIYEAVFLQLRLPRVLLCAITGAVLASSGVLMQGLFRNPIVEPGLVGTSAGAAFGSSIVFVLAAGLSPQVKSFTGPFLVPIFAFAGALLATYIVYSFAKTAGKISATSLLLVGVAINAAGLSGTGFMSYIARDPQARSITFWNLGTFSGASWLQVLITFVTASIVLFIAFKSSKQLNALLLGDEDATYLGTDTNKLKKRILILNTAMVAVVTAFAGVISFVGLIVPHIVRLLIGSDNKKVLPASMIFGAIVLTIADIASRLLLAPAEIPIGIITSLVGAPIFILLLKKFALLNNNAAND
jgi:iron complex transport system permease protein